MQGTLENIINWGVLRYSPNQTATGLSNYGSWTRLSTLRKYFVSSDVIEGVQIGENELRRLKSYPLKRPLIAMVEENDDIYIAE